MLSRSTSSIAVTTIARAVNFLRTDIVVMGIIVIGVVAYLFDLLMRWIEREVVPWKGRI